MVECLTWDQKAAGTSLNHVTVLCPWATHINPSLALVQPRKTRLYITDRLLMGRKEKIQTNKIHHCIIIAMCFEPAIIWTHTCILQTNRQTYIQTNSVKLIEHTYIPGNIISIIAPKTSKHWLGIFLVLIKTNVVGTQKKRLNETVLLSTQNILFRLRHKKIVKIVRSKFSYIWITLLICTMRKETRTA